MTKLREPVEVSAHAEAENLLTGVRVQCGDPIRLAPGDVAVLVQ